jgi:hypothetical protein
MATKANSHGKSLPPLQFDSSLAGLEVADLPGEFGWRLWDKACELLHLGQRVEKASEEFPDPEVRAWADTVK